MSPSAAISVNLDIPPKVRPFRVCRQHEDRITMYDELEEFYDLLDELEYRVDGKKLLQECSGDMNWPRRGVYFFFENGERRGAPGTGCRVVRVGTHAISRPRNAGTRLWTRLRNHRGTENGGGSRENSIFRGLVGRALRLRDLDQWPGLETWPIKRRVAAERLGVDIKEVRAREAEMEEAVSAYIGAMPFLWVAVDDEPGPGSDRARIEKNAIGLLSDSKSVGEDPASRSWLGLHSGEKLVVESGLWNRDYVGGGFDPEFLSVLKKYVAHTGDVL